MIGIGNDDRHDDAAGLATARLLRSDADPREPRVPPCGAPDPGVPSAPAREAPPPRGAPEPVVPATPPPGARSPLRVVELAGGATELLEAWAGEPAVVVVDAMASGAPPGTVRRFDAVREPLPAAPAGASTHGLGLAEAVGLARTLGRLPARLVLVGIEGADFSPGRGLTPAVAAAVAEAARLVRAERAAGA